MRSTFRTLVSVAFLAASLFAACGSNEEDQCPAQAHDGTSCPKLGLSCEFHSPDQGCNCEKDDDGQLRWLCIPELLQCPEKTPTQGASCDGIVCAYPGTTCTCNGSYSTGKWAWDCVANDYTCPATAPAKDSSCLGNDSIMCDFGSSHCFCSAGGDWTCW